MRLPGAEPGPEDHDAVVRLLGREPRGEYTVAVRGADGGPVVLCNRPVLRDGTPMPTLFWLCGRTEVAAVGRLESEGAVDAVEAEIGLDTVDGVHRAYAALRDALMPENHDGPRPTGGVGGTRRGVKCLHAHFGWWLAGGDDPVGEWVARRLAERGEPHAVRVA